MSTTKTIMKNYLETLSGDLRLVDMGEYVSLLLQQKQFSPRQVALAVGVPYRSFMNYLSGTRSIPLQTVLEILTYISSSKRERTALIDELYTKVSKIKSTSSNSQPIYLPKTYSKELAYLVGAIHDGTVFSNVTKKQYLIQFCQETDDNWLDLIVEKINFVFLCSPKRYQSYVQLCGKAIYEFFAKVIGVTQYQKDWHSFLHKIPREYQLSAIAGMFDAEGWVGNSQDKRLKFSQSSREKLLEVKSVLRSHNIQSGRVIRENDGFALWLCGQNSIDFATKVGKFCEHRNKRSGLTDLLKSVIA